jgi:hypothetical protein
MLVGAIWYFGLVFAAGLVLGMIRVPLLVPLMGERMAELLEMPIMFAAIYRAAGFVGHRVGARLGTAGWVGVGAIALGMLVAAELLVAVVLADRGIAAYLASRDAVSGGVYIVMLGVFAAMPWWRHNSARDRPG